MRTAINMVSELFGAALGVPGHSHMEDDAAAVDAPEVVAPVAEDAAPVAEDAAPVAVDAHMKSLIAKLLQRIQE